MTGALVPFLMGWLADTYGSTAGFSFLPLGVAIATEAAFWTSQLPEVFAEALVLDPVEQPVIAAEMRFSHVS